MSEQHLDPRIRYHTDKVASKGDLVPRVVPPHMRANLHRFASDPDSQNWGLLCGGLISRVSHPEVVAQQEAAMSPQEKQEWEDALAKAPVITFAEHKLACLGPPEDPPLIPVKLVESAKWIVALGCWAAVILFIGYKMMTNEPSDLTDEEYTAEQVYEDDFSWARPGD